jgi:predicted dehydrogenase
MTRTLRYGVVGAGYFGAALAHAIAGLPNAEVTAVFSPRHADELAEQLGCGTTSSVEELTAAKDVDVVVVASPNHAHVKPTLSAARHGKHVFCEKPVALSYHDCDAMIAACTSVGVQFMAGHIMHFMDGVRRVRNVIADGVIGDVILARAARTGWEDAITGPSWKKSREHSGGHLYHHIHELDLVQLVMGQARRVTMSGGNVAHRAAGFGDEDDLLLATLEFDENRFAFIELGSAFRWPEHYVLFQGTLGAVRIDLQNVGVEVRSTSGNWSFPLHRSIEEDAERTREYRASSSGGGVTYGSPSSRPPGWLEGLIEREVAHFHRLVRGGPVPVEFATLSDGSAARASIATADALRLSLQEDRKVSVVEIGG